MFRVVAEPIDDLDLAAAVRTDADGAVVLFRGVARRFSRGRQVVHLEYEAYPEMAEKMMAQIGGEIAEKWPGSKVAIVHRTGVLDIGEASVVIAVATPHRAEGFAACQYAIDRLKAAVPIWKKEAWSDGSQWIGWEHDANRQQPRSRVAGAETTRPPLVFKTTVHASQQAVFDAFFREPRRWLCQSATIEQQRGGRLRVCWADSCAEGRFVQFDPPSAARFSWHFEGDPLPETMVIVSLQASAAGDEPVTAVTLEQYGFGIGADWDLLYLGCARAWAAYLKNLRAVLEAGLDLREPDE